MVKNDIERIKDEINKLLESLTKQRERYKKSVNDLYEKENPFPKDRLQSQNNFGYDIQKFDELIGHSLIADDTDILYRWGIKPLRNRELSLSHNKLEDYRDYYTKERAKKIATEFEKALIKQLTDALETRLNSQN